MSGAPLVGRSAAPAVPSPNPLNAGRLAARIARVDSLDTETIDAAFELFDSLYLGADRKRFEEDLSDKRFIILLHDEVDKTLRGFSSVYVGDAMHEGRPARLIFSGDTAIHPAYWGQKRLQRAFSTILVREKLSHPTRPLLWFLISKGYKTYLLLVNYFPKSFPRVDRPPDHALATTLESVASRRFGDAYNPLTGVVSYPSARERVRSEVAPLNRPLMSNPHVAFFSTRNPGHERGDELACLAQIRLVDSLAAIVQSWRKGRPRRSFN